MEAVQVRESVSSDDVDDGENQHPELSEDNESELIAKRQWNSEFGRWQAKYNVTDKKLRI